MTRSTPQIISCSRRTDIPAFYGRWFRNRLEAGWCEVRNPFSGKRYRVSLSRGDVLGWVFWSRNYRPFLETLRAIYAGGRRFLCHFTITNYPRVFERRTIPMEKAAALAHRLASEFGPEVVHWRYDPIVLSSITPMAWHRENFARLAEALEGAAGRCVFSFVDMYRKTRRNLGAAAAEAGVRIWRPDEGDFSLDDLAGLVHWMAAKARRHGMNLYSCCESRWVDPDVPIYANRCVDWPALRALLPGGVDISLPRAPSRQDCGCFKSVDIGSYHNCAHGCVYCYAVEDHRKALAHLRTHDPEAVLL